MLNLRPNNKANKTSKEGIRNYKTKTHRFKANVCYCKPNSQSHKKNTCKSSKIDKDYI